jgi:hypothetical protein
VLLSSLSGAGAAAAAAAAKHGPKQSPIKQQQQDRGLSGLLTEYGSGSEEDDS